jgi:hypothetical protein
MAGAGANLNVCFGSIADAPAERPEWVESGHCCKRIDGPKKADGPLSRGNPRTILATIHRLSGRRLEGGADKMIGAEHLLDGWDSINLTRTT